MSDSDSEAEDNDKNDEHAPSPPPPQVRKHLFDIRNIFKKFPIRVQVITNHLYFEGETN